MDVLEDIIQSFRNYTDIKRYTVELCKSSYNVITSTDDESNICHAIFIPKLLKEICTEIIETITCDHLIIVCQDLTPQCIEYLSQSIARVQVIPIFRLEYNILRSPHVPKYTIMSEKIDEKMCLTMLRTDPVSILMGLRPGDVVKEESPCPLTGMTMRYRKVIY